MSEFLKGKTAIVTGSSRGIGEAIAIKFGRLGANVIVNYSQSESKAHDVVKRILEQGGAGLAVKADVSSRAEVEEMVSKALEHFGSIHILVNNAAYEKTSLFKDMSEEEWNRVISVNLTGSFLCAKAVWDIMRKQKWGRIINISSVLGITGEVGLAHYASTKAGQVGLTKVLSREGERYNIRVNAVLPGLTKTDGVWAAIPEEGRKKYDQYGRLCMPEDIAEVVAFLVSDASDKIRGQAIMADGGQF
jgi:3-oxoacyl-[acyl-carrier protein] reductase